MKSFLLSARIPLSCVCLLAISMAFLGGVHRGESGARDDPQAVNGNPSSAPPELPLPDPLPELPLYTHPTPQRNWNQTDNPKVYMPTGSGRVQSALYGSTRTNRAGRAVFHEGVDIAPVEWDRRGRAADDIFALSDGTVGYINRVAGNSSYGIYVVLEHPDPAGPVYSLYSHLASVESDLRAGQSVKKGQVIGRMGNTSTLNVPLSRSHLHFEIGFMINPSFSRWYRAQELIPDHGNHHGHNLTGFDPMFLLQSLVGQESVPFSFQEALDQSPTAFNLLVRSSQKPNYFGLYAPLWRGESYNGQALVMELTENGGIKSGRNATDAEIEQLGRSQARVLEVDTQALGRNGARLIQRQGDQWSLAPAGTRWLEIVLYDAGSTRPR